MALVGILAQAHADETFWRKTIERDNKAQAALLSEARTRIDRLVDSWGQNADLRQAPYAQPQIQWFLKNPVPAYLALDEVLAEKPVGDRRRVALLLTELIDWPNLGQHLPPLLDASKSDAERLEVIRCMASLHDPESLKVLEDLVRKREPETNEKLLAGALRGLGLSRRPQYRDLILAVEKGMKQTGPQFEAAKAAFRSGDDSAIDRVGAVLADQQAADGVKADAIRFLVQEFDDRALQLLAAFVRSEPDSELGLQALRGMIAATRFGQVVENRVVDFRPEPLPAEGGDSTPAPRPAPAPELSETNATAPSSGPMGEVAELSSEERLELVGRVLQWWQTRGKAMVAESRANQVN